MIQASQGPQIVVALDYDNLQSALQLAERLEPGLCRLKVGKELFTRVGPSAVEALQGLGFDVFLDLKFHDIPATVGKAVRAASELGVWMVNVHVSGGLRMLDAAREAVERSAHRPLLTGVTVLTSMGQEDLAEIGVDVPVQDQVIKLSGMAKASGLDGVVCSAVEAPLLSNELGDDFVLVTPGIRPVGSSADDQRRIVTPRDAVQAGSHYLVIGRPITQAEDPTAVCRSIIESLAS